MSVVNPSMFVDGPDARSHTLCGVPCFMFSRTMAFGVGALMVVTDGAVMDAVVTVKDDVSVDVVVNDVTSPPPVVADA